MASALVASTASALAPLTAETASGRPAADLHLVDWFLAVDGSSLVCYGRTLASASDGLERAEARTVSASSRSQRSSLIKRVLGQRIDNLHFHATDGSTVKLVGPSDDLRAESAGVPPTLRADFSKGVPPAYEMLVAIAADIVSLAAPPVNLVKPGESPMLLPQLVQEQVDGMLLEPAVATLEKQSDAAASVTVSTELPVPDEQPVASTSKLVPASSDSSSPRAPSVGSFTNSGMVKSFSSSSVSSSTSTAATTAPARRGRQTVHQKPPQPTSTIRLGRPRAKAKKKVPPMAITPLADSEGAGKGKGKEPEQRLLPALEIGSSKAQQDRSLLSNAGQHKGQEEGSLVPGEPEQINASSSSDQQRAEEVGAPPSLQLGTQKASGLPTPPNQEEEEVPKEAEIRALLECAANVLDLEEPTLSELASGKGGLAVEEDAELPSAESQEGAGTECLLHGSGMKEARQLEEEEQEGRQGSCATRGTVQPIRGVPEGTCSAALADEPSLEEALVLNGEGSTTFAERGTEAVAKTTTEAQSMEKQAAQLVAALDLGETRAEEEHKDQEGPMTVEAVSQGMGTEPLSSSSQTQHSSTTPAVARQGSFMNMVGMSDEELLPEDDIQISEAELDGLASPARFHSLDYVQGPAHRRAQAVLQESRFKGSVDDVIASLDAEGAGGSSYPLWPVPEASSSAQPSVGPSDGMHRHQHGSTAEVGAGRMLTPPRSDSHRSERERQLGSSSPSSVVSEGEEADIEATPKQPRLATSSQHASSSIAPIKKKRTYTRKKHEAVDTGDDSADESYVPGLRRPLGRPPGKKKSTSSSATQQSRKSAAAVQKKTPVERKGKRAASARSTPAPAAVQLPAPLQDSPAARPKRTPSSPVRLIDQLETPTRSRPTRSQPHGRWTKTPSPGPIAGPSSSGNAVAIGGATAARLQLEAVEAPEPGKRPSLAAFKQFLVSKAAPAPAPATEALAAPPAKQRRSRPLSRKQVPEEPVLPTAGPSKTAVAAPAGSSAALSPARSRSRPPPPRLSTSVAKPTQPAAAPVPAHAPAPSPGPSSARLPIQSTSAAAEELVSPEVGTAPTQDEEDVQQPAPDPAFNETSERKRLELELFGEDSGEERGNEEGTVPTTLEEEGEQSTVAATMTAAAEGSSSEEEQDVEQDEDLTEREQTPRGGHQPSPEIPISPEDRARMRRHSQHASQSRVDEDAEESEGQDEEHEQVAERPRSERKPVMPSSEDELALRSNDYQLPDANSSSDGDDFDLSPGKQARHRVVSLPAQHHRAGPSKQSLPLASTSAHQKRKLTAALAVRPFEKRARTAGSSSSHRRAPSTDHLDLEACEVADEEEESAESASSSSEAEQVRRRRSGRTRQAPVDLGDLNAIQARSERLIQARKAARKEARRLDDLYRLVSARPTTASRSSVTVPPPQQKQERRSRRASSSHTARPAAPTASTSRRQPSPELASVSARQPRLSSFVTSSKHPPPASTSSDRKGKKRAVDTEASDDAGDNPFLAQPGSSRSLKKARMEEIELPMPAQPLRRPGHGTSRATPAPAAAPSAPTTPTRSTIRTTVTVTAASPGAPLSRRKPGVATAMKSKRGLTASAAQDEETQRLYSEEPL